MAVSRSKNDIVMDICEIIILVASPPVNHEAEQCHRRRLALHGGRPLSPVGNTSPPHPPRRSMANCAALPRASARKLKRLAWISCASTPRYGMNDIPRSRHDIDSVKRRPRDQTASGAGRSSQRVMAQPKTHSCANEIISHRQQNARIKRRREY